MEEILLVLCIRLTKKINVYKKIATKDNVTHQMEHVSVIKDGRDQFVIKETKMEMRIKEILLIWDAFKVCIQKISQSILEE